MSGGSRIRTYVGIRHRIYSPAHLAALVSPRKVFAKVHGFQETTNDLGEKLVFFFTRFCLSLH